MVRDKVGRCGAVVLCDWMGMMSKAELLALLEGQRDVLTGRFAVKSLAVFGSAVRDAISGGSDVDLLVEFDTALGFDRYFDLKFFLEDLFGRPVDLVTRRGLRTGCGPVSKAKRSMSREWRIYVSDMLACCDRVTYTDGVSRESFDERGMVFDATVRNLELLGEAANQLPDEVSDREKSHCNPLPSRAVTPARNVRARSLGVAS